MTPNSGPTETERKVAINTAFGEDAVVFHRMTATEHMGRMFQFEVEILSADYELKPKDILGTNTTVRLETGGDDPRYFNGFVTRFAHAGRTGRYAVYRMSLRPWFWFLTRTADCRIFQNKTVPQVIEQIFRDLKFSDFDKSGIKGSHPKWEYCVQYRETDFNFVSRLTEQEGIYYWFKHENGKHTLMLTDDYATHKEIKGCEEVHYFTEGDDETVDHMTDWGWRQQIQPGRFAMRDYNFETLDDLRTDETLKGDHAHANYEIYDYPGEYGKKSDGDDYVKYRIEEQFAQHDVARGAGVVRGLHEGGVFKLKNYWRGDQNKKWLVLSITHELLSDEFVSATEEGEEGARLYKNSLTAIPSTVQYRTPRITRKPEIKGPQTAVVVGKSGEEIWPDQHGRVKVQFHWDREGKADENSSCWIRVSTPWAGKKWGHIKIPRIGHEVIVDFLEGDPDRPIILGEVYHKDNKPPYTLPDHKTRSGVKSNSSKGGGGFNEIRFEDKKGEEQIFVHAEKNQDIRVKATRKESIGGDRHLRVGHDKREYVKRYREEIVDGGHFEKVIDYYDLKVEGVQKEVITQGKYIRVEGNEAHRTTGKRHDKVDGNYSIELVDGRIVLEAATNITLRVGGSVISIDPAYIEVRSVARTDVIAQSELNAVSLSGPALFMGNAATTLGSGSSATTIVGSPISIG